MSTPEPTDEPTQGADPRRTAPASGAPAAEADRAAEQHRAAEAAARSAAEERARREAAAGPATAAMPAITDPALEPVLGPHPATGNTEAVSDEDVPDETAPRTSGSDIPGVTDVADEETLHAALTGKPVFPRVLQWVVAILTPLVVLMGALRLVASGGFLWLEYHRPGFPADAYGFDTAQRTTLGSYGVDFINGFAGRDYLATLRPLPGTKTVDGTLAFRDPEVAHMVAVQSLLHLGYLVAVVAAVLIGISFLVLRSRYAGGIRRGLFAGAWVTLGILLVLGTLGALGWDTFFTDFHRLFFSGGQWEFYLDDTLIRLYPPQFWVDAAITVAALAVITCLITLILTWPTRRRRDRSVRRQAEKDFRLA